MKVPVTIVKKTIRGTRTHGTYQVEAGKETVQEFLSSMLGDGIIYMYEWSVSAETVIRKKMTITLTSKALKLVKKMKRKKK